MQDSVSWRGVAYLFGLNSCGVCKPQKFFAVPNGRGILALAGTSYGLLVSHNRRRVHSDQCVRKRGNWVAILGKNRLKTSVKAMMLVAISVLAATWAALAQEVKRPVLSSHDRVDGPLGGESHVEDLKVFEDGKVVYVEEATNVMGGQPQHSAYEAIIGSDGMRRLTQLLDSPEIRSLPKKASAKIRPIDFFWQKSLEINRPE